MKLGVELRCHYKRRDPSLPRYIASGFHTRLSAIRSVSKSPAKSKPAALDASENNAETNAGMDPHQRECWWLYLLECRGNKLYAGISTDLAARFAAHCSGKGARFTRANPPLRVIAAESHTSRSAASIAEFRLKALSRDKKLEWARTRSKVGDQLPTKIAGPKAVVRTA